MARPRRALSITRVFFAAAAALIVGMTSVSYLAETDATFTLSIAAPSYTTADGEPTTVTGTSAPVSIIVGNAQKIAGHQLFRIEVGDPVLSDRVQAIVFWLNSEQATQVLSNPNSFVDIGFFHDSGTAPSGSPTACPADEFKTLNQLGNEICVTPSAPDSSFNNQILTPMLAEGTIISTTASQQYLYVLATIYVPGGAVPGQQPLSGTLDFELQLSLRGG